MSCCTVVPAVGSVALAAFIKYSCGAVGCHWLHHLFVFSMALQRQGSLPAAVGAVVGAVMLLVDVVADAVVAVHHCCNFIAVVVTVVVASCCCCCWFCCCCCGCCLLLLLSWCCHPSVCLSVFLSVFLFVRLSVSLSFCPVSLSLSICLPACLSVCLSVCLSGNGRTVGGWGATALPCLVRRRGCRLQACTGVPVHLALVGRAPTQGTHARDGSILVTRQGPSAPGPW